MKQAKCPYCPQEFRKEELVQKHIEVAHPNKVINGAKDILNMYSKVLT